MSIDQAEFAQRRNMLLSQLEDNSCVLIESSTLAARNSDVDYLFRQDSNFFYFSGFNEPDALLLLKKCAGKTEYHMFCQPRDKEMEIWFGYRTGEQGLLDNYQVDFAYSNELIDDTIGELLNGVKNLYYSQGKVGLNEKVHQWLSAMRKKSRAGVVTPSAIKQLDDYTDEMRLFKSEKEQQIMALASDISAGAHVRAMKECKPGVMEYQLDAHIQHHFAMNGCAQAAYPSIVGGGKNACVLHYIDNNKVLNDNDLVLIDAGAECQYYAGDITRTFPVNGKFSTEQKALYEIALKANIECIEMIKPGTNFNDVHDHAVRVITTGLVDLGLLNGDVDELIDELAYRDFFMHKLGHWLGMDVHDVGNYKIDGQWRELQAGMAMTIEPGIYVSPDNTKVAQKWRGIGIRIEDDVLVTDSGVHVMTAAVPKTVADIEALMSVG